MYCDLLEDYDSELWKCRGVVYCYTNKINGKKYVGQTIRTIKERHNEHVYNATIENLPFYNAINKYGIDNFTLELLLFGCEDYDILNETEIYYIDLFRSLAKENGYNIASGGKNANNFAGKTKEEFDEIKQRISRSLVGRFVGEKHPNYGKTLSEEHRKRLSESHKGKKLSEETRKKMSERCGEKHPFYGKTHLEETRKKISESLVGRFVGENSPNYGRTFSEESRQKMSEAHKGKKLSEEHKRKIKENANPLSGVNAPNARAVIGININTSEVLKFDYARQATEYDFDAGHISKCCKGQRKSHKGYKWFYLDEYEKMNK